MKVIMVLSIFVFIFGCTHEDEAAVSKKSDSKETSTQNDDTTDDSSGSSDNTSNNGALDSSDCPPGYIPVPGNTSLNTNSFCVMKYEAQNGGQNDAVSVQGGSSYVSVSASTSFTKCANSSANGFDGTFELISNDEWMTIAREIELNPNNWSSGLVGGGMLNRGHSDTSSTSTLVSGDDSDPYSGTGNNSLQSSGSGWEQKRTHELSNGQIIWDFAGNIWEWVDWDNSDGVYTSLTTNESGCTVNGQWEEFTSGGCPSLDILTYRPSDANYDSSKGVGFFKEGTAGAAHRGGASYNGSKAGIYTINLEVNSSYTNSSIGFRCVYHP